MARRQLLTREALAPYYDPPTDERETARHCTLSREDLDLIGERRGASSRLGFALLLLYMRWPGRVLEAGEKPPGAILAFVADQIDVQVISPATWLSSGPICQVSSWRAAPEEPWCLPSAVKWCCAWRTDAIDCSCRTGYRAT